MADSSKHHYLSIFHQLGFTNESGRFFVFDKKIQPRKIRPSKPINEFFKRNLNTITNADGSKHHDLELFYDRQIESPAAPILKKLIQTARCRRKPNLALEEKSDWLNFVNHQRKRPQDAFERMGLRNNFEQKITEIILNFEKIKGRELSEHERSFFESGEDIERLVQSSEVYARGSGSQVVLDALAQKGLALGLVAKRNKSFIIGDYPFVKLGSGNSLAHVDMQYWLPISSDVIVGSLGNVGENYFFDIGSDLVRTVNKSIFGQSNRVAARSKRLIALLAAL